MRNIDRLRARKKVEGVKNFFRCNDNTDLMIKIPVLVGVAQWVECRPANQSVASSVPSQGTYLGYGPDP